MKVVALIVLLFLCSACAQSFTGSYVKYDYCVQGSSGCTLSNCGNTPTNYGFCIADAYILLSNCTASGLGVNQPPPDPNVVSFINCNSGGGLRTNYSSLAECKSQTNPLLPTFTTFSSLGYSSFCYGGTVAFNQNPFGQFNMTFGYYVTTTYACPGNYVTAMTFVQDPAPHSCVSDQKSCSGSAQNFVVSTVCYPGTANSSSSSSSGSSSAAPRASSPVGGFLFQLLLSLL